MRATIFQGKNGAVRGADKHNRLASKTRRVRPPGFHLGGPGDWIPMVWMRANFAEVVSGRRRGIALKHSGASQRETEQIVLWNTAGGKTEDSKASLTLRCGQRCTSDAFATSRRAVEVEAHHRDTPPEHDILSRQVSWLAGHCSSPSSQDQDPSDADGPQLTAHSCGGSASFASERDRSDRSPASLLASYEWSSPKTTTPPNMGDCISESSSSPFAVPDTNLGLLDDLIQD
jgi:hypothetical protein